MNVGEYLRQQKGNWDDFEAQLILAHVLGRSRTWLLAHLDAPLTAPELDSTQKAFTQFQTGTPLPYILGHWEFFGLDFNVTKDVLIPRPETELLVENAIRWLTNHPEARSAADIGTGSGAIAVTLATQVPNLHILATDISPAALDVAQGNAKKFKVEKQIEFAECDLLPANPHAPIHLLCANLPYIPTETLHGLPIYGREPTLALDGGLDGLDLYRKLLKQITNRMAKEYLILFEIENTQGQSASSLASQFFPKANVQVHQDLAGHDRLIEVRFS